MDLLIFRTRNAYERTGVKVEGNLITWNKLVFVHSQQARIELAKSAGVKIGFVERTHGTNRQDGPCPHYLPKIVTEKFAKWHKCEQCGYKSNKPIKPYQAGKFVSSEGIDMSLKDLVKTVTDKF